MYKNMKFFWRTTVKKKTLKRPKEDGICNGKEINKPSLSRTNCKRYDQVNGCWAVKKSNFLDEYITALRDGSRDFLSLNCSTNETGILKKLPLKYNSPKIEGQRDISHRRTPHNNKGAP